MSTKRELSETVADSGRSSETGEMELGTKNPSQQSTANRVKSYLDREIDSKATDLISIYACFLTGFTSAHSFSVRDSRKDGSIPALEIMKRNETSEAVNWSNADLRHVIFGVDSKREM